MAQRELPKMQIVETKKNFGAAVRSERTRLGLSQETLAERASLHRTYITDIERGARNLSLETIYKLSTALGVSIETLFARAEVRQQWEQHVLPVGQLVDVLLVEDEMSDAELTLEALKRGGLSNRGDGGGGRARPPSTSFLFAAASMRTAVHREQSPGAAPGLESAQGAWAGSVAPDVKEDERTRHIQVVVLTASKKDEHIQQALSAGCRRLYCEAGGFLIISAKSPRS